MKVIANYLPQFHCIPENDERFGDGYTEWTAVRSAEPFFELHNQPRIPLDNNYYSLLDADILKWQCELARQYGIDGFAIYHYYFQNGRLALEKPAELLLRHQEIDISYFFIWANESWGRYRNSYKRDGTINQWTSRFDSGKGPDIVFQQEYGDENQWRLHYEYVCQFFRDKRYILVEGKPVFAIYKPRDIADLKAMIRYWRKLAEQDGFPGLYIIGINIWEPEEEIDAVLFQAPNAAYHSCVRNTGEKNGVITKDYRSVYDNMLKLERVDGKVTYFGGFVDFDNTPRYGSSHALCMENASPFLFEEYLKKIMEKNEKEKTPFLFINAWNEWGEGNYLEPDEKNGYAYLEAVSRVTHHNNKEISVIIPVYNVEDYLQECLESVLHQTFRAFELICVDDGSVDESCHILDKYQKLYPDKITVIKIKHAGVSAARNVGMEQAQGKYVYFMDADDILHQDALEISHEICEKKSLEVLFFSFENFCRDKELTVKYQKMLGSVKRKQGFAQCMSGQEAFCYFKKHKEYFVTVWLQLVKKSFLVNNRIKFQEDIIYEDQIYTLELLNRAEKVFCIDDVLYYKRIRKNSICTSEKAEGYLRGFLNLFLRLQQLLMEISYDNDYKHYLKDEKDMIGRKIKTFYEDLPENIREKYFSHCTIQEKMCLKEICQDV